MKPWTAYNTQGRLGLAGTMASTVQAYATGLLQQLYMDVKRNWNLQTLVPTQVPADSMNFGGHWDQAIFWGYRYWGTCSIGQDLCKHRSRTVSTWRNARSSAKFCWKAVRSISLWRTAGRLSSEEQLKCFGVYACFEVVGGHHIQYNCVHSK